MQKCFWKWIILRILLNKTEFGLWSLKKPGSYSLESLLGVNLSKKKSGQDCVKLFFFVQVNLFRISCPCPIRVSFQVPILSRSPKEQLGFLVVTDFFSRFLFCDNREGRKLLRLLCRKEKLVHRVVMNDWQTGSSSLLVQLSS